MKGNETKRPQGGEGRARHTVRALWRCSASRATHHVRGGQRTARPTGFRGSNAEFFGEFYHFGGEREAAAGRCGWNGWRDDKPQGCPKAFGAGEWTGLTFDQVRNDERWLPWRGCRSIAAIPGGESWRQVQDRVVGALFDLRRRHPGGAVALVWHGDVIRAALLFGLGMPLDLYNRIEIGTGSISTIRIEEDQIRIPALNERPR